MQSKTKFQRILTHLFTWLLICGVTYAFLSLCNWSINMKDWGGFSRFILGAEGVIFIFNLLDEL